MLGNNENAKLNKQSGHVLESPSILSLKSLKFQRAWQQQQKAENSTAGSDLQS